MEYIGQYEDDIQDLIEFQRRKSGESRFFLGGHSSGGGLAIRFAANRKMPEPRGLVLLAPYLAYDAPTQRPGTGGWAVPNVPRIIGLTMLNHVGVHYFDELPVLRFNRPSGFDDPFATLAYSHRLRSSYEPRRYREDLKNLRMPVYVLVGSEDDAFFADQFEPVFRAYAADSRVDVLVGTDHLGLVGDGRVIKATITWLKGRE